DGQVSTYFLTTFGRPTRDTVCSCEVRLEPTLSQSLHLLNGETVGPKIQQGNVVGRMLAEKKTPAQVIEHLYIRCLTRTPRPAEKPKVALIGCGGQGRSDAKKAARFGTVVAVCDVDANRLAQAAKQFDGAKTYSDFRKLLEAEKDVGVVINGTPDHWHTLVNLAALKAGKDVYSEKPLTLTIDEGKRLVAAVKASNRILQTGSQQRSDARFRLACEAVRNGRLGQLTQITTTL